MKGLFLILVFSVAILFASCGGGGGGGTNSNNPPPPGGETPAAPAFTGFDFTLATGNFWEFRWDYYWNSWAQGSTPTTTRDAGRFWVVLGQPLQIQGTTAYEVQLYGKSRNTDKAFTPKWKYLAMANNKMLGSTDGSALTTIFDADKGYWAGGGFFMSFPSNLIQAKNGGISNTYITDSNAIVVERSSSQSECQYYPEIGGSICGDSSYTYNEKEFYKGGLGPLGYRYYNSYSDCGGGFCSGGTWDHNVGLTASSFKGNSLPFTSESEPNDTPSTGAPLTPPAVIIGDCLASDTNYYLYDSTLNPAAIYVEDWYTMTIITTGGAQRTVKLSLDFEASTTADLDLFLFDANATNHIALSGKNNPALNDQNETITATLSAGIYRIGVDAYATPNGRVKYMLQVE